MSALKIAALAAVLGALAGLGLGWWHYSPRLAAAEGRADRNAGLLREQNRAIDALQAEAARRAAEATEALKRADAGRRTAERRAQELLARPLPPGQDACEAASALIRDELGR